MPKTRRKKTLPGSNMLKSHCKIMVSGTMWCQNRDSLLLFRLFLSRPARPFRNFKEKHMLLEQWPSKTRRKIQILESIHGAVMKNESPTLVKHVIFKQLMSKTRRTMHMSEFVHGAVVKNSSTTLVKHIIFKQLMSKARRKIALLTGNVWKHIVKSHFWDAKC